MSERNWEGYCRPTKDQGNCGSCTAFGGLKVYEGLVRIAKMDPDYPIDMSERDLFACSYGLCDKGNTVEATLNRMMVGFATEECCPYEPRDIRCGTLRCADWWVKGKRIKSWRKLNDLAEVKEVLLNKGPVIGTMAVHQSFLHVVSNDVYHSLGPQDPMVGYHMLAILGFSDRLGALRLGNSWGYDWGVDGNCWIKYYDSEVEAYTIELSDEPVDPDTPDCEWSRTWLNLAPKIGISDLQARRALQKYRNTRYRVTGH